jgi:putative oxidoreductase
MAIGLLILRTVVGLTLAAHGAQKLFGWFGGYGLAGTGAFFEKLGFIPGTRSALLAGLAETFGGLLIAIGLGVPFAAGVIFAVMGVAIVTVHLHNGFFVTKQGYEYNVVLATAAIALAFTGAGDLSVDALVGTSLSGPLWGLAAIGLGIAGTVSQLAMRRTPALAGAVPQKAS